MGFFCGIYKKIIDMEIEEFISIVKPYTMTSVERIRSLFQSLEYIRKNNIQGDIVECGVWKGGNILGCLEYMKHYDINKTVWLYDTFSGMTQTTNFDIDLNGVSGKQWESKCDCTLQEVKDIIDEKKYPNNKIKFIVGDITETLKQNGNIPKTISLLRLDTDWYESTKIEMETLYPNLTNDGVLIIDDYGHWVGAKKAVDEYFTLINKKPIFEVIDYTGIKIIK
jgi:hypothetical protein